MVDAGIRESNPASAFLVNAAIESASFNKNIEDPEACADDDTVFFEAVFGSRTDMDNLEPGDGSNFRGRGRMQVIVAGGRRGRAAPAGRGSARQEALRASPGFPRCVSGRRIASMPRRHLLIATATLLLALPSRGQRLAFISDLDASRGLKAALESGSLAAVRILGVQDGFLGNPKVRIPLPSAL